MIRRQVLPHRIESLAFLCLAAAVVLSAPAPVVAIRSGDPVQERAASDTRSQVELTLATIDRWAAAVEQHEAGTLDEHARDIDDWGSAEIAAFVRDIPLVLRFVTRQGGPAMEMRGELVPHDRVRRVLRLTDAEWRAGDVTRLARRGALLHADLGQRVSGHSLWGNVVGDPRPTSARGIVAVADGHLQGSRWAMGHWRFGRFLLDRVKPAPSRDPVVVSWYRGAAAFLLGLGCLADAESHLRDGVNLLPDDPIIRLYEGVLHEAYASPAVQAALGPARLQKDSWVEVKSSADELRQARTAYSRALEIDPGLVEARLHLGRVLGRLGKHAEAARELRLVAQSPPDPLTAFYAGLFLGAEEEALGRLGPARKAYEAADAHYPQSQSLRLALAHLSWRAGDRAAARAGVLDALSAPESVAGELADPWWTYPLAPARHADAFFEAARLAAEERR